MKFFNALVIIFALGLTSCYVTPPNAPSGGAVIYGEDNFIDFYDIVNGKALSNALATCSLWNRWQIYEKKDSQYYYLTTWKYGDEKKLEPHAKFYNQPVGAFCSGVLVKPDVVATAGHCVERGNKDTIRFVFGYEVDEPGKYPIIIDKSNIYKFKEMISYENFGLKDIALVRLDRPVNRKPVNIAPYDIKSGDDIYMIGYPSGLPLKYCDDAIINVTLSDSFFASLDTHAGSSGSPIFDSRHNLVGLCTKAERAWIFDGKYYHPRYRKHTAWGTIAVRIFEQ